MNGWLVNRVSALISVRLYGQPDVAIGHAFQLLPNVQTFFVAGLRAEFCSLGPIIIGRGHCRSPKRVGLRQNAATDHTFLSVRYW